MSRPDETILATALKFYDMYNTHEVDRLDELLAPEYVGVVNSSQIVGLETAKAVVGSFLSAFPDVHYDVEDTVSDGNKVVVRWQAAATHLGTFAGLPQTGKQVTMVGITMFEIRGEQISALWNLWDVQGLLGQLQP